MRIIAGVCFAALALAACNKPADKTPVAAGKTEGATAPAPVPAGVEAAPKLKAGLWELTSTTPGFTGQVRTCIDPAVQGDSAFVTQGMDRRNCSHSKWSKTADGYAFDVACEKDGRLFASTGVVSGDFTTHYSLTADAVMSFGSETRGAKQQIEAKNVGACPADLKPGEALVKQNNRWMRPATAVG